MTPNAVLVCGGRDYADAEHVFGVLDAMHGAAPIDTIIHGGAQGADALAHQWAKARGVRLQVFPAEWAKHGKGAGPIRNQQMLDEGQPSHVVAFPGGRGTADMARRAVKAGVHLIQYLAAQGIEARQGGDGTAPREARKPDPKGCAHD